MPLKLAIIGRGDALLSTAKTLHACGHQIVAVVTAKPAPEYLAQTEHYQAFASHVGALYEYQPRLGSDASDALKAQLKTADLGISVNYPNVIPQHSIDLFSIGLLNAHGGDLPRYKGNACQAWAIINGETQIGLCVHKMMGDALDSGDIVARDYLDVLDDTRIGEVYDWMESRLPSLFDEAVKRLEKDPNFALEAYQAYRHRPSLRCFPRTPEDGKIDWRQSSQQVGRLINASSEPFAGAFCQFQGKRLIIWRATQVVQYEPFLAIPGQVAQIAKEAGFVDVCCGEGQVRLLEIEYDGVRGKPTDVFSSIRARVR